MISRGPDGPVAGSDSFPSPFAGRSVPKAFCFVPSLAYITYFRSFVDVSMSTDHSCPYFNPLFLFTEAFVAVHETRRDKKDTGSTLR